MEDHPKAPSCILSHTQNKLPPSTSYQHPKQQFDNKKNLKQHVVHFLKTCNSTSIDEDLLDSSSTR